MFNYGSFKLLLLKVFYGIGLIVISSFLILSLFTYHDGDPGIGKFNTSTEISNFFGFLGAISSSFLLVFFGNLSMVVVFFIFYSGVVFVAGYRVKRLFIKFILINLSLIFLNLSLSIMGINIL